VLDQEKQRFFLVREDILPEAIVKTIQAKELLAQGTALTVHDAAEAVGLSRSAFYKYKDGVYSLSRLERDRLITISMDLLHKSGILSRVLALIASYDGNVLTIHQTIPLQGMANVVITVDSTGMGERLPDFMKALQALDGVKKAMITGQGA
jgi:chorismate mutase